MTNDALRKNLLPYETIVAKGGNASHQHFLLFPQYSDWLVVLVHNWGLTPL